MIKNYSGVKEWHVFKNTITHKKGNYFLVCVDGNRIPESILFSRDDLMDILKNEEYTFIKWDQLKNAPWMFIDIETKVVLPGKVGVSMANPIGGHALTPREFLEILKIYSRYTEKELLKF